MDDVRYCLKCFVTEPLCGRLFFFRRVVKRGGGCLSASGRTLWAVAVWLSVTRSLLKSI